MHRCIHVLTCLYVCTYLYRCTSASTDMDTDISDWAGAGVCAGTETGAVALAVVIQIQMRM